MCTDVVIEENTYYMVLKKLDGYDWSMLMLVPTSDHYAQMCLRVADNGIGMSPEFVQKIFSPFERERTSTVSRTQGTGLGMAITKNIVDMMGGTIEVRTEQGKGTEYIVRLPIRIQSEHKHIEKIAELEGLKALVVDDDFNTCDSVTKMLVIPSFSTSSFSQVRSSPRTFASIAANGSSSKSTCGFGASALANATL